MDKKYFTKSGIVLVNKPVGMSSNKAVNTVKYALGAKKCGHLGTLDLEGEGLLPVTVNNATRLFEFFLNKDKTYETEFIFGFETDTLDTSGQIIKQKECDIQTADVERVCKEMLGKYMQMPPQYSAKKIGGQTAYKLARAGEKIDLKPKEVEIYSFKLLKKLGKNKFRFEVSCSSGTYIRSLCRDMAEKLDTYGSMQCILRTRCGGFMLSDAKTIKEIEHGEIKLVSCEKLFDYDRIDIDRNAYEKLLNGQILKTQHADGDYKIYCEGEFVGVGFVSENMFKLKLRLD